MSREEQVRSEIQTFLLALDSYPERFSREPRISFEEHLRGVGLAKVRAAGRFEEVRPNGDGLRRRS